MESRRDLYRRAGSKAEQGLGLLHALPNRNLEGAARLAKAAGEGVREAALLESGDGGRRPLAGKTRAGVRMESRRERFLGSQDQRPNKALACCMRCRTGTWKGQRASQRPRARAFERQPFWNQEAGVGVRPRAVFRGRIKGRTRPWPAACVAEPEPGRGSAPRKGRRRGNRRRGPPAGGNGPARWPRAGPVARPGPGIC